MTLPVPDLDDRTYSQMRDELVLDITHASALWTDHNIHDPGVTILEMLAWKAEMLLYRFNKLTDRHRLKFLRFLGVSPEPARPARALLLASLVTKSNGHDEVPSSNRGRGLDGADWPVFLPSGSEIEAVLPGDERIGFTTEGSIWVTPHKPECVVVRKQNKSTNFSQAARTSGLFFNPFGPDGDPATHFMLGLSATPAASESGVGIPLCLWYTPYGAGTSRFTEGFQNESIRLRTIDSEHLFDIRPELLFNLPPRHKIRLKDGPVAGAVKKAFKDGGCILSRHAVISRKDDATWDITDGAMLYRLKDTGTELGVHDFGYRTGLEEGPVPEGLALALGKHECYLSKKAVMSATGKKRWNIRDGGKSYWIADIYPVLKVYDTSIKPWAAPFVEPPVELVWEYNVGKDIAEWKELAPIPEGCEEESGSTYETQETVIDGTLALTREGPLRLHIGPDAKPLSMTVDHFNAKRYLYWVRCRIVSGAYEAPPAADMLVSHVVPATQYRTALDASLLRVSDGSFFSSYEGSGLPSQRFELGRSPVLHLELSVGEKDSKGKAGSATSSCWTEVPDFDASGPLENHYTLDRQKGIVAFGDGIRGRLLPVNATVMATVCRWGGGPEGNVDRDTSWKFIKSLKTPGRMNVELESILPAFGGAPAESIASTFTRALKNLDEPHRAITLEDYELLSLSTPGLKVARAKASSFPGGTGVEVIVIPQSILERPMPGEAFLEAVRRHLDALRLLTVRLKVSAPDYVPVKVTASVLAANGIDTELLAGRVSEAICDFLHPLTGGPDGRGWPFGRPAYLSEMYEVCERVEGLDCVEHLGISSPREGIEHTGGNVIIGSRQLVYAVEPTVDAVRPATGCRR